jgi:hypothetical protein
MPTFMSLCVGSAIRQRAKQHLFDGLASFYKFSESGCVKVEPRPISTQAVAAKVVADPLEPSPRRGV